LFCFSKSGSPLLCNDNLNVYKLLFYNFMTSHVSCEKCLIPLSTIFQLLRGCHFELIKETDYSEKTTDLSQVTNKFNFIKLYRVDLASVGFKLTTGGMI
jgi:hypothetical protein